MMTHAEITEKRLTLGSIPEKMKIHSMELDLTWDCNLGCIYCYKGERHQVAITKKIAFDAVTWLFYASALSKDISIFFMGGEPLLQFDLIKQLVPYAKRRAAQQGKNLFISTTTNCTLVTDEVLEFYKKWNVGFHTSIDGVPEVQNHNRPFAHGGATSSAVTNKIPDLLKYLPHTTARATVLPENVDSYSDNYRYFRELGYTNIALIPSDYPRWDRNTLQQFEQQLRTAGELWKKDLRQGYDVSLSFFQITIKGKKASQRRHIPCGAGRGLVSVDVYGNIWPCNRWEPHGDPYWNQWNLGNIYTGFNESAREDFMRETPFVKKCNDCPGRYFCGGGCYAANIVSTGDIRSQHDQACEINRIQASIAMELHDELYAEKCPALMKHFYPEEWERMNMSVVSETNEEENNVPCDS